MLLIVSFLKYYNKVVGFDSSYLVQMVDCVKHYIVFLSFLKIFTLKRRLKVEQNEKYC
jgi:hypothetical protein